MSILILVIDIDVGIDLDTSADNAIDIDILKIDSDMHDAFLSHLPCARRRLSIGRRPLLNGRDTSCAPRGSLQEENNIIEAFNDRSVEETPKLKQLIHPNIEANIEITN